MMDFEQPGALESFDADGKKPLGVRLGFSGPMTVITAWRSAVDIKSNLTSAQGPKDVEPVSRGFEEAV